MKATRFGVKGHVEAGFGSAVHAFADVGYVCIRLWLDPPQPDRCWASIRSAVLEATR